jgi:UrcA family protein
MTQDTFELRRVSERVTSAAAALAMTALLAIASDAQAAGLSVQMTPSVSVPYSSADIATEEGAANLYRTLKRAAREVCDVHGIKTLAQRAVAQKCFEKSLENAVYRVNAQRVTALHAAETSAFG